MNTNKSKHTPGKWNVLDYGEIKADSQMGKADYICRMPYSSESEYNAMPEAAANAALIAAAPSMAAKIERLEAVNKELLAALEALCNATETATANMMGRRRLMAQ